MSVLDRQVDGFVYRLTMHDAARRNALTSSSLAELVDALHVASVDGCRALILDAQPVSGVWSAGHDIDELPSGGRDPLTWDNPLEAALRAVRDAPFPVIAVVEGSVWGGACDLVFTCDVIVAVRMATFAITPARLGIPYNTEGVAHFVSALPVHVAKEMFFTADPIDADRLERLGVVNRLADDAEGALDGAQRIAQRIATLAPLAIRAIKAEISALTDARALTSETFERLSALRTQAWTSADYREGLAAFHEKRQAQFTGE